ncbi:Fe(2+) transport protein 1-like protein [Tanacetum coccineum]|uniref:Fe(2+) transport protein 1-like protein n=1 Tax=Tanacetum coccineum TaxID=301880 RepID=A0ABQ5AZK2_9ASTR
MEGILSEIGGLGVPDPILNGYLAIEDMGFHSQARSAQTNPIHQFFQFQVVGLSNYEEKEDQFKKEPAYTFSLLIHDGTRIVEGSNSSWEWDELKLKTSQFPFTMFIAMMSAVGTLMIDSYMMSGFKKYSETNNGIKNRDPEMNIMGHCHGDVTSGVNDRASQLRRYRMVAQVLELGIVVHSVVIGLSMGASDNMCTISPLVAALCFHQFFEGTGLGRCILQADYEMKMKGILVFFFSMTTPLGIAFGVSWAAELHGMVDLLAADFLGKRLQDDMKFQAITYLVVLLGAGGMSVVQIFEDRAEIRKCNMRIVPTKTQKEATYQVVLDTLKLSPCYNAFTITADVPEIYMHQFWFTISKIKDTSSYKFDEPPSHEETVSFVKEISYKRDLQSITELFTDQCINHGEPSLLSSTDVFLGKLQDLINSDCQELKSCGGLYYKKNVDFLELIWEDIMYQVDNRYISAKRRTGMPYPRFTKAIIQHFFSEDKTISMRNKLFMHTIKDASVLGGLKFVSKHDDSQVYGKTIPNAMVFREIMETTTYTTYLAFSTRKAIPKKVRKRTKSATTSKKKGSLMADDNIISEDPDAALELAKSISKTEAEEQEAARLVLETHKCLAIEKSTRIRKQTCVIFKDISTVSKKKPLDQSQKLKGVQVMSVEECLVADTKKAIKASKLATGPQQTAGSSEGVGVMPEVPDEPTVVTGAHDDSEDSWGTESDIEKSDEQNIKEGDVPWIYSDDDEEDDNDDDQSIDIVHMDDDERTESYNEYQAMDDVENNDEDKAKEEKDTDQEPIQDKQAKDKEVKELRQVGLSTTLRASIRSEVLSAVNEYFGSSLGDALQKELQKHTEELRQEYS